MHTKEPWEVNDKRDSGWMDNSVYLYADQHGNFAKLFTDAGADSVENARRIVACVNACAGLRTEDLEYVSGLGFPAQKLIEQRDELLATVKEAAESFDLGDCQTVIKLLNEAIAKADLTQ